VSVITFKRKGLSETDVSVLTALSYKLSAQSLGGACVPAIMDDGERMAAILNPENDVILFGFGRDQRGYYVFDWEGRPLIEGGSCIDEILEAFT
jgi:hypothetical protein